MTFAFRPIFGWALITVMVAAFMSLFLSLQAGVFVLLFAIVAWWVSIHPHHAVLLLVVIAPLLPMFKITNTIGTITLIKDVIILTLFVTTFGIPLLQQKLPYRRNALILPLLVLGLWTAFEVLQAQQLTLGILRARDIVLYVLLFFGVLYLPYKKGFFRELLIWFLVSAGIAMILGVYQWIFALDSAVLRFDPARSIWIPRVSSILAHPSVFGQYLITVGTLLLVLVLYKTSSWLKAISGILFLAVLSLVYFTYSRAVWIGLAVGIAVIVLVYGFRSLRTQTAWLSKKALIGISLAGIIVVIVLMQLTSLPVFFRSIFDPTYKSNEARLEFLARLIAPTTNTQAIIGQGLGDVLSQNFREIDIASIDIAAGDARSVQLTKDATLVDNQYLKTFIEMGLIGLLIYGWIYFLVAQHAYALTRGTNSASAQRIGIWALGFLAAFVIQGLFIDIWEIFPTNLAFWIIAALVFRFATVEEKNHE